MKSFLKTSLVLAIVFTALLGAVGCRHRVSSQPVTPYENVLTWNDALAQTNNVIARGLIAVSPSLVPAEKAGSILRYQKKIAQVDEQLTGILREGPEYAKINAATVKDLLNQLGQAGQGLISSGAVGVKNPSSQQTFDADIQAVNALVANILGGLKASGVIQ